MTFFGATIKFSDGNTRYNGIATAEALSAWLGRYGVSWSADGQPAAYGPGIATVQVEQLAEDGAETEG
jgi:hypothetical protein